MSSQKPTVLIIGATGRTGRRVIDGLIESGNYVSTCHLVPYRSSAHAALQNVVALTRPSSISKPQVSALRERGVEIRVGDCVADPPAKLAEYVRDVDILLSTINAEETLEQTPET